MSKKKRLLSIIKDSHERKISHDVIEKVMGNNISSNQAIELFQSIGISIIQKGDSYEYKEIDFLNEDLIRGKNDQIEDAKNIITHGKLKLDP